MLTFGDIGIGKNNFYRNKITIFLRDVDIEEVLVSNKSYWYNDAKVQPLNIKTSAYIKRYDGQTKWMYFLIEDDDF